MKEYKGYILGGLMMLALLSIVGFTINYSIQPIIVNPMTEMYTGKILISSKTATAIEIPGVPATMPRKVIMSMSSMDIFIGTYSTVATSTATIGVGYCVHASTVPGNSIELNTSYPLWGIAKDEGVGQATITVIMGNWQ
jgi:hypothetical protein